MKLGYAIALVIGGLILLTLSMVIATTHPARADDVEDKPLFACKRAIFAELRDPDSAKALYSERVVQRFPKGWIVILPVRATNAFGAMTKQTFVCGYRDGKVLEVR